MSVHITNLQALYNQMVNFNMNNAPPIYTQIFNFIAGAVHFNVCFSINENPFTLALTTQNDEPEFFLFHISQNFELSGRLDNDTYRRLANVLNQGQGFNRLVPAEFFTNLNNQTPTELGVRPNNAQTLAIRQDITEQRDRPYFDTWRHHTVRNVTAENLAKTLALLGREAYEYSIQHNASSIWSADPIRRN